MDQVLRLDLGSYLHSAVIVTASWLSVGGLSGLLSISSVSTFAPATSARLSSSPNYRLQVWFLVGVRMTGPLLLGVVDVILQPYFHRWCWYHPIQGPLHSVHVEHTH